MKYQIKTSIKTFQKVWSILADLGLQGFLTGEALTAMTNGQTINLNPIDIINKVLAEGFVNDLCQTITGQFDVDFEELEIDEVVEVLSSFFQSIAGKFKGLAPIIQSAAIKAEVNKMSKTQTIPDTETPSPNLQQA